MSMSKSMKLLPITACLVALISLSEAQILSWGCNSATVPGPVRNLNVVINRYGDGGRIHFKQPAGPACVDYYEVRMVEDGPTPRAVSNIPSQTKETTVVVRGLRPGQEYLVTVTAVNSRGRGESEMQTVVPVKATSCNRKPAAVEEAAAQYVDAKTMAVSWVPGDDCYIGADVQVIEDNTDKVVYTTSVADVAARVTGLKPKTTYRVNIVPYAERTQHKGPMTTIETQSPCDATVVPGKVVGLKARGSAPAGTVLIDVQGVSNEACVASWEFNARAQGQGQGQGNAVSNVVKVTDPSNPAVSNLRLNGRPNQRYTIQVTAISPSGRRGITGSIGPILADGRTQTESGQPTWGRKML